MKCVSLLPSATELVCLVGGSDYLVGRSHECDYPPSITDRAILTGATNKFESCEQMNDAVTATLTTGDGLYYINAEVLKQLAPDVIVTQSLCNVCSVDLRLVEQVVHDMQNSSSSSSSSTAAPGAAVVAAGPKIVSLNPSSIEDVLTDALIVGQALGLTGQAEAAVAALKQRVEAALAFVGQQPPLKQPVVVFLEWFEPLFPGGHWTPQLIQMAGGQHPLNPARDGRGAAPSKPVWNADLVALDPDWIIICPCGLDLQETIEQLPPVTSSGWWPGLKAVQQGRVALVDGNQMFNRPGPRLVDCLEFLVGLLHERHEVIPHSFPWRFLQRDELAAEEEAWLDSHPGWKTRVQKGPPNAANGEAAAGGGCCSGGSCVPAAAPAAAAAAAPAGEQQ